MGAHFLVFILSRPNVFTLIGLCLPGVNDVKIVIAVISLGPGETMGFKNLTAELPVVLSCCGLLLAEPSVESLLAM